MSSPNSHPTTAEESLGRAVAGQIIVEYFTVLPGRLQFDREHRDALARECLKQFIHEPDGSNQTQTKEVPPCQNEKSSS